MPAFPSRRQFLHRAGTAAAVPVIAAAEPRASAADPAAVELVKSGKPLALVVADAPAVVPKKKGKNPPAGGEGLATQLLVEWVKKITDAELPVADKAPEGVPAIYVGKAAVAAGLKLEDIVSASHGRLRARPA